jgi:NADH-quinone oxidoreductase subunit G
MDANVNVSEGKPPLDSDSPLSFTMEGYAGIPPAAITPFYWSPGWNSVQAINKYQIEVGGPLHGGNPGKRLFEPGQNVKPSYFKTVPLSFSPKEGEYLALPTYHIFGSDELSSQSPAVKERIPQPYISLNRDDAMKAGISEGTNVEVVLNGETQFLPARLDLGMVAGVAGIPKGLKETAGIQFPVWITLKKSGHE